MVAKYWKLLKKCGGSTVEIKSEGRFEEGKKKKTKKVFFAFYEFIDFT